MSTSIDERIVQMRFNNQQFEQGAKQTIQTMDKLRQSLNLTGAAKGFDEINKVANGMRMDGMYNSLQKIEKKFSVVGLAGMTVLNNLVNSAVNVGKRMAQALTIAPVTQGFQEYELKMGSVQTIMASTGESLATVNKYLEELNAYSDRTIYSFSDMTNNIGKFTNAGVKLEDAVAAIKGISNEAAVSGANANEASRAMYNFAQALSAGYVKLIDWKSIENANMATVEFKNELIKTAVELGTVVKVGEDYQTVTTDNNGKVSELFNATKNFNDALSAQWMTTDVLVQTLRRYTDETTDLGKKAYAAAQDVKTFSMLMDTLKEAVGSGWAYTWEIIFGDFEEAKELWTGVNDVVGEFISTVSDARNDMLRGGLATGWKNFTRQYVSDAEGLKEEIMSVASTQIEGFTDMIIQAGSFEKSLKDGWLTTDILGKSLENIKNKIYGVSEAELANMGYTQETYNSFMMLWQNLRHGTITLDDLVENINRVSGRENLIKGLANVFKALTKILGAVSDGFHEMFPPMTAESLYSFTVAFRELSERMILSEESLYTIKVLVKALLLPFQILVEILKTAAYACYLLAGAAFDLIDSLIAIPAKTKVAGKSIEDTIGSDRLTRLANALIGIFNNIVNAILAVKNAAVDMFTGLMQNETVQSVLEQIGGTLKNVALNGLDLIINGLEMLSKFDIISIPKAIGEAFDTAWEAVQKFFGLFNFQTDKIDPSGLHATTDEVDRMKGVFAAVSPTLRSVATDMVDLSGAVTTVQTMFSSFVKTLGNFLGNLTAGRLLVLAFGTSVTGLAYSMIQAMDIVANGIAGIFTAAKLILTNVATAVTKLSTAGTNLLNAITKRVKPSLASQFEKVLVTMAASILVLTIALGVLSQIPMDTLKDRVLILFEVIGIFAGAMTVMLAVLGVFNVMAPTFAQSTMGFAVSIGVLAAAILVMIAAFNKLASIDFSSMSQQLLYFVEFITITMGVMTLFGSKYSGGVKGAFSMVLLATAIGTVVKALEKISNANLSGIKRNLGEILIVVGLLIRMASISKNVKFASATGLLILIADMLLMVNMLEMLAEKDVGKLTIGVLKMIPLLAAIVMITEVTSTADEAIMKTGVGIMFMAGAIIVLAQAAEQLGKLDAATVTKGTTAVVAMLLCFSLITKWHGEGGMYADRVGKSILLMSTSILLLQFAVRYLGEMEVAQVAKGVAAVSMLLIAFGIVAKLAKQAEGSTGVILSLGFVIGILTTSLVMLELLDTKSLIAASAGLAAAMLSFSVVMKLSRDVDPKGMLKSLGAFALVVGMLALLALAIEKMGVTIDADLSTVSALVTLMSTMGLVSRLIKAADWKDVSGPVMAMGIMLGAAAVALSILGDFQNPAMMLVNATALSEILMALAACTRIMNAKVAGWAKVSANITMKMMGAFLAEAAASLIVLNGLGGNDPAKTLANAVALSAILEALALATRIIDGKAGGTNWDNVVMTATLMGAMLAEIAIALSLLNYFGGADPVKTLANATAMSGILIAVSGAAAIIGATTKFINAGNLPAALGAFTGVIGIVAALSTAFGALMQIDGFKELITNGVYVFEQIGLAIGSLVGGLAGGIAAGIGAGVGLAIEQLGKSLGNFGESIQPFLDAMNSVDGGTVGSIGALTGAILALTAAEFLSGIGQLLSFISGKKGNLGDIISEFAEPLIDFAEQISAANIDPALVTAASTLAEAVGHIVNAVPREGGVLQTFLGEQDMTKFALGLAGFALAITGFAVGLRGLTEEDYANLEHAASIGQVFADLNNNLPRTGGALQDFIGNQDLQLFATNMSRFGWGIWQFSHALEGITNWDSLEKAGTIGTMMAELNSKLPYTGGALHEWILGDQDLNLFSQNLSKFGWAIFNFAVALNGTELSEETARKAVNIASMVAELDDVLPETTSLKSILFGKSDWEGFQANLTGFADAIKAFVESISTINIEGVDPSGLLKSLGSDLMGALIDGMKTRYAELVSEGGTVVGRIMTGMNAKKYDLGTTVTQLGQQITTSMRTALGISSGSSGVFNEIGKNVVNGFIGGVQSKQADANNAMKRFAEQATAAATGAFQVNSPSKVFQDIGNNLVYGLNKGVEEATPEGCDGMVKMGGELLDATRKYWRINSPSLKAKDEVGHYIVQGIAEGITEDMTAEDAAHQKAMNVIEAFQKGIDDSDIDTEIANLQHKIWGFLNPEPGENASAQEKAAYAEKKYQEDLSNLQKLIDIQAGNVSKAEKAYEETKKNSPNDAEAIKNAEKLMLTEQAEYYDLANQIATLNKERSETLQEELTTRRDAYNDYVKVAYSPEEQKIHDELIKQGFSEEAYMRNLQKRTGYDPNLEAMENSLDTMTDVHDVIEKYKDTTELSIEYASEEAVKKATDSPSVHQAARSGGTSVAKSVGEGASSQAGVNAVSQGFSGGIVDGIKKATERADFSGTAAAVIDGLVTGAKNGVQSFGEAMRGLMKGGIDSAKQEADINSPSKVTYEMGQNLIRGLVMGVSEGNASINENMLALIQSVLQACSESGAEVAIKFMEGFAAAAAQGSEALQQSLNDTVLQVDTNKQIFYTSGQSIGDMLMQGLQQAIEAGIPAITQAAQQAARSAYNSAMAALGGGGGDGGRMSNARAVGLAMAMSGGGGGLDTSADFNRASSTSAAIRKSLESPIKPEFQGNTYITNNLTQNNTSPKALSRSDIYRDTKNLFATTSKASVNTTTKTSSGKTSTSTTKKG